MSPTSAPRERTAPGDLSALAGQVRELVEEVTGRHVPDSEVSLVALGVDSMALLDIMAALEARYDIALNETVAQDFLSTMRIARIVQEAVRVKAGGK